MAVDFSGKPYLLFDGAMGTMLQKYGLKIGGKPEVLNITNPEVVMKIHREYIDAGSDIITANTFGANAPRLKDCEHSIEEIVTKAVKVAKEAAGDKLVALDIGPTGEFIEPLGDYTFEEMVGIFAAQVKAGAAAGADLILIETFSDLAEAKAAIKAAKDNSSLPVICTFTFQKEGRTFMGHDVKTVVSTLEDLGLYAIGLNCSVGPKDLLPIVEEMLSLTKLPVIVQPNAGLPEVVDGNIVYNVTPLDFAETIREMYFMGVRIFGGCCGTSPEFIKAIKDVLSEA